MCRFTAEFPHCRPCQTLVTAVKAAKCIGSDCVSDVKLAFHDADTDIDILARILADTSYTRLKLFLSLIHI